MISFHQEIQLNGKCLSSYGYNNKRSGNVLFNKLFKIILHVLCNILYRSLP